MTPETSSGAVDARTWLRDESGRGCADERFDYSDESAAVARPRLPRLRNPAAGTVPPPIPGDRLLLRASAWTDVGLGRDRNEDAAYVDAEDEFFIVADGGGAPAELA